MKSKYKNIVNLFEKRKFEILKKQFLKYLLYILNIFILSIGSFSYKAFGKIISTGDAKKITKIINDTIEYSKLGDTFIAVQMQNVLFRPVDKYFYQDNSAYHSIIDKSEKIVAKQIKSPDQTLIKYASEIILSEYKQEIIDPNIVIFFNKLIREKIPLIIMTNDISGSFNNVEHFESWTYDFLKKNKIDLSFGVYKDENFVFDKEFLKLRGSYPTFYRGLLSASSDDGQNSLNRLLVHFFSIMDYFPQNIIVIHNEISVLEDFEMQFNLLNYEGQFIGIHYKPQIKEVSSMLPKDYMNETIVFYKKIYNIKRPIVDDELKYDVKK